jgi:hypothetical protein
MQEIKSNIGTQMAVKDGVLIVNRVQDCDPIAEHCKNLAAIGADGSSDMKFAGSIPNVMVEKYCNDKGISYAEFIGNRFHVKAAMNDPAMAAFRVWKGKL